MGNLKLSGKSLIKAVGRTVLITDQSRPAPLSALCSAVLLTSLLSDSFYLISSSSFTWAHSRFYSPFPLLPISSLERSSLSSLPGIHSWDYLFIYTPMQTPTQPPTGSHTPTHQLTNIHPPTHTSTHALTATTPQSSSRRFVLQTSISYFSFTQSAPLYTTCINTDHALSLIISALLHPTPK